jgi:2-polyprenyl-3-methyl-5-hydroxy-6-metoxy-1,4-benzoquinol methylase
MFSTILKMLSEHNIAGRYNPPEHVPFDQMNGDFTWNYYYAFSYVRDKSVLDAGCGVGYGTVELAKQAKCVVGVDLCRNTVRRAKMRWKSGNLDFVVADCSWLPFRERIFDVVTCFEVIEHLTAQETFVADIKKILSEGGILILSTPKPYGGPYHMHEFTPSELYALLSRYFQEVKLGVKMTIDSSYLSMQRGLRGRTKSKIKMNRFGWLLVAFLERFVTPYHFTVESFIFTDDLEKAGTLLAVARKD